MNICSSGKGVYYLNCQWHIQKKFGDNFFSWASGLLSSIPAKFYSFIFCTLLATFFLAIQRSFEQKQRGSLFTWEIDQKTTIFFFSSSFLGIFFGVPITFELYHFQSGYKSDCTFGQKKKFYDVNLCINWES